MRKLFALALVGAVATSAVLIPAFAPPPAPLVLKNMVGKVVTGGTYSTITLINCLNCTVKGAIVTPPPAATINSQAVRIVDSPNVRIEGLTITGQAATTGVKQTDPGPAGLVIGLWAGEGIHIERSPNSVLSHNVITKFHQGIAIGKQDNLTIEFNTIANMRTSGIVGTPGNNLKIIGNGIGSSHPWRWGQTPAGDHGDKIHLWTAGGSVTGLTITDNALDDGNGVAILGIFIQNKAGSVVGTFDQSVIERNTIRIGQTLAMMLTGVRGSVSWNTLVPLSMTKPAAIYSSWDNAGIWRGNTGGKGVVFNSQLSAAQKARVTVIK